MRRVEDLTREELIQTVREYENGITWMTSCTNCAKLMDKNYSQYCEIQQLLEYLND